MIPPAEEAGSAAAKQEVLETYRRPCEPSCPVVCRDEQPARPVQHPLPPQGPGLSPARTTANWTVLLENELQANLDDSRFLLDPTVDSKTRCGVEAE